ncbi:hypothetical protein [Olivibacter sitiensis]|uniref:hypothetical protein n=1 Tax=Olivibacter sitiensis TaxID=376470 RepID=UPI000402A45F|nr:hypothetical protein [Olivibacter sitiensis]
MSHKKEKQEKDIIVADMRDHGNDPYFINKARQSKAFLDKHGFPKELLKERKSRLGI